MYFVSIAEDVLLSADIIFWAVKPQIFPGCVDTMIKRGVKVSNEKVISHISVMAGITLADFQEAVKKLGAVSSEKCRCFRVMPNIGLKVNCGVAGMRLRYVYFVFACRNSCFIYNDLFI